MPRFSETYARAIVEKQYKDTVHLIGSGISGFVYGHGNSAIKVIRQGHRQELDILKLVSDHENIVSLEKFFFVANMIILQMPYCGKNGYLITRRVGLPNEPMQKQCMKDLFCGLDYLHTKGILHLDPKPENVFYCGGKWLLADLGNAHLENRVRRNHVHYTCFYRCPLAAVGVGNKNTDIFAMTLCIRELITGYPIYKNTDEDSWEVFARHLDRTDLGWFLKVLDKDNAEKILLLTQTISFSAVPPKLDPTPFFASFDQKLRDTVLNYTCSGGQLFLQYCLNS